MAISGSLAHAVDVYRPGNEKGTVGGCGDGFMDNLAYDNPSPTIPESLTEHSRTMCKMVIEIVPDRVYLAWGYALASPTMIIGDDGLIIIDPPEGRAPAREMVMVLNGFEVPVPGGAQPLG